MATHEYRDPMHCYRIQQLAREITINSHEKALWDFLDQFRGTPHYQAIRDEDEKVRQTLEVTPLADAKTKKRKGRVSRKPTPPRANLIFKTRLAWARQFVKKIDANLTPIMNKKELKAALGLDPRTAVGRLGNAVIDGGNRQSIKINLSDIPAKWANYKDMIVKYLARYPRQQRRTRATTRAK